MAKAIYCFKLRWHANGSQNDGVPRCEFEVGLMTDFVPSSPPGGGVLFLVSTPI